MNPSRFFLLRLALLSAWNRRGTLFWVVLSLALSTALMLAVEGLRQQARATFEESVAGVDLIVGPRNSPVQILLQAVFQVGEAGPGLSWASAQALARQDGVAWTVPIALGDSLRGYPVLGTTPAYLEHMAFGGERLRLAAGAAQLGLFQAVVGSEVAARLGYRPGDRLVLSHGMSLDGDDDDDHDAGHGAHADDHHGLHHHDHGDKPFQVTGVLVATGTPVDRQVLVSLASLQAIHLDWQGGAPLPGFVIPPELVKKFDLTPKQVDAVFVGLERRSDALALQRAINDGKLPGLSEPMTALLPVLTLERLWQVVAVVERALRAVAVLVLVTGLAGMVAALMAGLNERRRELALLRAVGAGAQHGFWLLALEGLWLGLIGVAGGVILVLLGFDVAAPRLWAALGFAAPPSGHLADHLPWAWLPVPLLATWFAALLPGWRAWRLSLADGLTPRL
ncbi:ABC transporter permease [Denitratisoma sp. agr-D3]